MKAEDEWSALTSKVAGLEQGYKRTACILALCPLSELADSSISLNPFCKVSIVKENETIFRFERDALQGTKADMSGVFYNHKLHSLILRFIAGCSGKW
jgi:hypothetical protein